MSSDMKETIAEAARHLLMDKNVKKLTVTDIVSECHITRQTFYYHFEDVPNLLKWTLDREAERLKNDLPEGMSPEESIRYFFRLGVSILPYARKSMQSNYQDELVYLFRDGVYKIFYETAKRDHMFENLTPAELDFVLRYHTNAILGLFSTWTDKDTENIDFYAHTAYLLLEGKLFMPSASDAPAKEGSKKPDTPSEGTFV